MLPCLHVVEEPQLYSLLECLTIHFELVQRDQEEIILDSELTCNSLKEGNSSLQAWLFRLEKVGTDRQPKEANYFVLTFSLMASLVATK